MHLVEQSVNSLFHCATDVVYEYMCISSFNNCNRWHVFIQGFKTMGIHTYTYIIESTYTALVERLASVH